MTPTVAKVSLIALVAGAAFGQAAPAPAFEVASVKTSQDAGGRGDGGGRGIQQILGLSGRGNVSTSPGSLTMRGVSLKFCIGWAYDVKDYQISGPSWLSDGRFDIVAKAGGPAPEDHLRLMLQALLAERFKLALHSQSKELPAYALTVAKSGLKIHESAGDGPPAIRRNGLGMTAERISTAQFADILSSALRVPVVDVTGLKGRYDATVDFTPYIPLDSKPGDPPPDLVDIAIIAVQDLLGLKLEARKEPLKTLVIDHAERAPTEN